MFNWRDLASGITNTGRLYSIRLIFLQRVISFQYTEEYLGMNHIQYWFEKLAGIQQETRERATLAESLFAKPPFDAAAFHKPACWRRKAAPCSGARGR